MVESQKPTLDGKVEIDETHVGGKAKPGSKKYGLTGRGTENKL
jgi:hypothetical protein